MLIWYARTFAQATFRAFLVAGLTLAASHPAAARFKFKLLHVFCAGVPIGGQCTDGFSPQGRLLVDSNGDVLGTTYGGGDGPAADVLGTVFELKGKHYQVLHTFVRPTPERNEGANPSGGLVMDRQGKLYGVTMNGGRGDGGPPTAEGTLFQITNTSGDRLPHIFCSEANCPDGANPIGNLIIDSVDNLYGTTLFGGVTDVVSKKGSGTVFQARRSGAFKVLYAFCSLPDCADGAVPVGGLAVDSSGNLYGALQNYNFEDYNANGSIFKVTPDGEETVLHNFSRFGVDGQPNGDLVVDQSGNIYGTALHGGANNGGTIFRIASDGAYQILYSFCAEPSCADGRGPNAGVTMDSSGNLFGTTAGGGKNASNFDGGVAFELTHAGKYKVIHNFCSRANCADGSVPEAPLAFDSIGNLYGTTARGGDPTQKVGVVFELERR